MNHKIPGKRSRSTQPRCEIIVIRWTRLIPSHRCIHTCGGPLALCPVGLGQVCGGFENQVRGEGVVISGTVWRLEERGKNG